MLLSAKTYFHPHFSICEGSSIVEFAIFFKILYHIPKIKSIVSRKFSVFCLRKQNSAGVKTDIIHAPQICRQLSIFFHSESEIQTAQNKKGCRLCQTSAKNDSRYVFFCPLPIKQTRGVVVEQILLVGAGEITKRAGLPHRHESLRAHVPGRQRGRATEACHLPRRSSMGITMPLPRAWRSPISTRISA